MRSHDAPTALLQARRLRPEVVVLEIDLPVVDGYELARRLRQCGVERFIAMSEIADLVRVQVANFDAQLSKPIDVVTLHEAIAFPVRGAREPDGDRGTTDHLAESAAYVVD